jgi:DNA-directed RNA polymerase subunit F
VHRKFRLVPESLYVTQHVIDQFLSRKKIQKSQLHLLGVTTLHIAAKYEEIYPPDLRDFLTVSENKFTKQMVVDMEKEILTAIDFKVTAPSAYRFLQRFRRMSELVDDEVFFFAQYLQEIALLDITLLRFKPSQLAAASMILAARQLKKQNCWTEEVARFAKYSEADLQEAVEEIKSFALEINPKFISTLKYKFSKPEYKGVAQHPFSF